MKKYKAKYKKKPGPRTYRGLPVKDATAPLGFPVAQTNMKGAIANDEQRCVVAKTLLHTEFEGAYPQDVHVHRSIVMILPAHGKYWVRFKTPAAVRTQLMRFDAGGQFASGDYEIQAVPPSVIKYRGRAHSPPDRKRGDPDSPNKRKGAVVFNKGKDVVKKKRQNWEALGRRPFTYDKQPKVA